MNNYNTWLTKCAHTGWLLFWIQTYLFSSTIFHNKQPADHPFWNPLLTMYKADLAKTIVNPELLWEKPNILHKVDLAREMHVRSICHLRPNVLFISLLHPIPINENWHCIPNRTRAGQLTTCTLQKLKWTRHFSKVGAWTFQGLEQGSGCMEIQLTCIINIGGLTGLTDEETNIVSEDGCWSIKEITR